MTKAWDDRDRRALVAVATQFFANGATMATFVPRLPEIRTRIGVDTTQMGLVLAAAGLIAVAASSVTGRINERFGTRKAIVVGGLLMAAGLGAIGQAKNPFALAIALGWFSSSDAVVDVAMNMQGSWLSARRPTPFMNRLHALWSVGTFVGGFVTSRAAAAHLSVSAHTAVAAVVLAGVIVVLSRFLLEVDESFDDPDLVEEAKGQSILDSQGLAPAASLPAGAWKTLVPFVLAGICVIMFEVLPLDWAGFRLTDDFGAAPGFAALGFVATTVGMTAARLGGDAVVARFGSEKVLTASLVLVGTGLAAATLVPSETVALAGFATMGVGVATIMPKLYDDAARRKGRRGAGIGALSAGIRIGALSLPLVIGALVGTSLSVGVAIAICGAGALSLFLAIRPMLRTTRRAQP